MLGEISIPYEGKGAERMSKNSATYISGEELLSCAVRDFSELIAQGKLDTESVKNFVARNVKGIRLNGVDVVFIDFAHGSENLDDMHLAYLRSDRTKVIMPEYFYEELAQNAGITYEGMQELQSNPRNGWGQRLRMAQRISEELHEIGKPVAAADIANRPSFLFTQGLLPLYPAIAGAAISKASDKSSAKYIGLGVTAAWDASRIFMSKRGVGINNPDRIPPFERLFPNYENARRLFLTYGIEQLTTAYQPSRTPSENRAQIVVLTKKAHGIRAANILVNPHPFVDKAEALFYKGLGPTLGYSVRLWQPVAHEESPQAVTGIPTNARQKNLWTRVSNKKIRI